MQAYGSRGGPPPQAAYPQYQQNVYPPAQPSPSPSQQTPRRVPSQASYPRRFSSTSTTASNSGASTSYVSTLRRQRATVWTSQTQFEDPRLIAARVAEKQRASSELGQARKKARDKALMLAGAGVGAEGMGSSNALTIPGVVDLPERLSATELDDDEDDNEDGIPDMRRRSDDSVASEPTQQQQHHPPETSTPDENETPPEVGPEMKRRGSLDEMEARTLTMSGVRLFVANPD